MSVGAGCACTVALPGFAADNLATVVPLFATIGVAVDEFVTAKALLAKAAMNANALSEGCDTSMAEIPSIQRMGCNAVPPLVFHEMEGCETVGKGTRRYLYSIRPSHHLLFELLDIQSP